ncbi:SGNH/GDSL hydrolase family protein [Yinghuangia seranimata]|uniref:SGNH/GDSL hydrolase family protein n=1 Tax=Yinghuangia seranimata TaxID=408067 RepID=UPI00248CAA34|nr:SGNH/GDSL hydrolase family protein [Yinghuangia seranimata]MDI2132329.1 SGNH/GDSL hydrolase family protein [Yinghuangia seranimata]
MKSSYRQGFWRTVISRRLGVGRGVLAAVALAGLAVGAGAGQASAAVEREVYVALGDSMASGPLIPDVTGPLACARSTHNYAHELAASLGVDELRDVTCSGADTGDMTSPQHLSLLGVDMGYAAPQFDALSADTTLVTLTIGGNDAGLVGVAQDCVNLNPFAATCKSRYTAGGVDQVAQRVDAVGPRLATVLDTIHAKAPAARVVVTGYGLYVKPGGCWPVQPVLPTDADYLQANVDRLNTVIATQAAAHGAQYVDVRGPSAGHDICRSSSARWIEGFVPTNLAAPLHPNQRGEANYAAVLRAAL